MPTRTIRTAEGEKEAEVLEHGLIKAYLVNHNTGKTEYLYSRFEVVEGYETREQEIRMHRDAMVSKILERADDFLPVQILSLDTFESE